ncbi:MAG: O-antigen ligase family protein [Patescibacteria group bacterium]
MFISSRMLNWLFPLFAFLLPLQTRWIIRDEVVGTSAWEYGRISLYGFDAALIVIAALIIIRKVIKSRAHQNQGNDNVHHAGRRSATPLFTLLGVLFMAYEWYFALDPMLTLIVVLRLGLIGIAMGYVFHAEPLLVRRTLAAFVVAMMISSGLGVAQFIAQDDLVSSKWLGLAPQEASTLGVSVVEATGGRWLRGHGTMPHPNALGGFAALAFTLFLVLRTTSSNVQESSRPLIIWCESAFMIAAPLILIAGVITSVSRAAMIAWAVSLAIFLWQRIQRQAVVFNARFFMTVAAGTIIVLLFALPALSVRLRGQGRLESLSFTKRAAAFTQALAVSRDHWATGTGLGGITVAMRVRFPALPIWDIQPVHNVPVLLAVELGVGGLLILSIGLLFIRKIFNFSRCSGIPRAGQFSIFKIGPWSSVIACLLVLAMLDHYLWTLAAGLYLMGIMGASLALDRGTRNS